jgi:Putative peptidoglycan binding domain
VSLWGSFGEQAFSVRTRYARGVPDPDDWFGGAAADDGTEGFVRPEGDEEDWLHDVDRPVREPWYEKVDRRVVVAAIVAVALLIAILAAAGVFSSGGHTATPPPTTTTTTTTTTAQTTPAPAPKPVPAPTTNLKPGDTGAQVKTLQRALATLGYSPGKVDGDYGPSTQAAVEKFQASAGIKADGIVGPETLKALQTALANKA